MSREDIVGLEAPPFTAEVEKGAIRKFAEALGDPNPLFSDEEFAKKSKYGGMIAPLTFPTTFRGERPDVKLDRTKPPLFAGQEYEYFRLIRPGDKITCRTKVVDYYEKEGRRGIMKFVVYEMEGVDEKGEKVFKGRQIMTYFK